MASLITVPTRRSIIIRKHAQFEAAYIYCQRENWDTVKNIYVARPILKVGVFDFAPLRGKLFQVIGLNNEGPYEIEIVSMDKTCENPNLNYKQKIIALASQHYTMMKLALQHYGEISSTTLHYGEN